VIRTKIIPLALLALSFGVIEVRDVASAKEVGPIGSDMRRPALQMSKPGAAQESYASAVAAIQPLAESGDGLAQYCLGVLYRTGGQDLPQDSAKAIAWFTKAADQGDAGAMRELAIVYENGMPDLPADKAAAVLWYEKAANRGDALAQLNLGLKFATGQDLKKDLVQAYKWLTLAGRGVFFDDEDARRKEIRQGREMLLTQMTSTEVSMAERQAHQFNVQ